uniref:Vacuolar protein sorting-associated protein 11 homolog n=1 Tax=Macrostomum lignano TaxID=282301 RepID=A0A1I8J5J3_9PLAT
RFQFFETGLLRDLNTGESFKGLADIEGICCWSCGHGLLVFGDKNGFVYLVGRNSDGSFDVTNFRAFDDSTNLLHQFAQHDILISVGLDQGFNEQRLKVWSQLDRPEADGGPVCSRVMRVAIDPATLAKQQPQMPPPFLTCLTAHENLSCLLLGFSTGVVQLHRGDVSESRVTTVFATTDKSVFALVITAKDHVTKICLESNFGAAPCCTCLSESDPDPQLVVANRTVAYFYNMDGRGACTAFDMEIEQLRWFRSYLVALGKRGSITTAAGSQQQQQSNALKDTHMLTVYETRHKFAAMYNPFRGGVRAILAEWGSLLLLTADCRLHCLTEKDAASKMGILFKKNNFRLAIDLASAMRYDADGMAEIYRQYADYLYQKGDFDGAIPEYCRTIGHLEASYVIRKFLDSSRIHNLTAYLEAVHRARLASEDHTTLLLNCYSKLKDEAKLSAFLESKDTAFDADTAIRVLRQAGFSKQALALADRFDKHEWHLKIQVCDLAQHSEALAYMAKLPDTVAMHNMRIYGRELLASCPAESTELLKKLVGSPQVSVGVDELAPIFVGNPNDLIAILEHCLALLGSPTARPQLTQTLLELYIQSLAEEPATADKSLRDKREQRALELLKTGSDCYDSDAFLLRCYLCQFWPGVMLLCERTGRYDLLLRHYTERGQYDSLFKLCETVGHRHKDLWRQALLYYARSDEPAAQQYLARVLEYMRSTGLMSPLSIVSLLCTHSQATLGAISSFLVEHLRDEAAQAEADERIVEEARTKTQSIQRQMEELQLQPKVFQNQRCSICHSQLDIPSVHFLCDHSFHLHCFQSFSETEAECPNCAAENREALEAVSLWRSQSGDSSFRLIDTLSQANPSATFSIISDSIAKGVFWNGATAPPAPPVAPAPAPVPPPPQPPAIVVAKGLTPAAPAGSSDSGKLVRSSSSASAGAPSNQPGNTREPKNPFEAFLGGQPPSGQLHQSAGTAGSATSSAIGMHRAASSSGMQPGRGATQEQRSSAATDHLLSSSVGAAGGA